jgi:quinol monooxygenase YgiN
MHDRENAMLAHGLLARMKAQWNKLDETEQLLNSALLQVQAEHATALWFALDFGRGEYGIFDVFASDEGRQAHLRGPVATALVGRAPHLLDKPPDFDAVDILASKMPPDSPTAKITCGLLLSFRAKKDHEVEVEQFLRNAQPVVQQEPGTIGWFALRWPEGRYGTLTLFPHHGERFSHITGHVPRELARHALTLLGGMPAMDMLDVLASHVAQRPTQVGLGVD